MLSVCISFIALCALCLFFTSLRGVSSAFAPLLAISSAMIYFSIAGIMGVLTLSVWIFYALCFTLAIYAFLKRGGKALLLKMTSFGFLMFVGLSLLLLVYLGIRQPLLSDWDEFVFWGVAPKLMKQTGEMYTWANVSGEVGFRWTSTQFPGLPVLGWFVQFFSSSFQPWAVYWGYGILMISCVSALLAPFGRRQWKIAIPLMTAGMLVPFFFTVPYHTVYFHTTWLTSYADLPAGMLFGGVLAMYFASVHARKPCRWQVLLPLCALALTKDNVFPVALVAAGIMAADTLFFSSKHYPDLQTRYFSFAPKQKYRHLVFGLFFSAVYFLAPTITYLSWQNHSAAAVAQNPFYGGNQTNEPLSNALSLAVQELLGILPKSENYYRVVNELISSFTGRSGVYNVSMIGTGLVTLLFIVALFVLAAVCYKKRRFRLRVILSGTLLLGGFLAFHFMLLVVYAYFSHTRDEGIFDYARYTGTFTVGMMMLGLLFLALSAKYATHAMRKVGTGLLLCITIFMLLRTNTFVRSGYSILDYPSSAYATEIKEQATAKEYAAVIEPESNVFFVSQTGDGSQYMRWHYHLLPIVLEYSITGGGNIAPPSVIGEYGITLEDIRQYITENDCDYILIDSLDDTFITHYSELFEDGLQDYTGDGPALYRLGDSGLFTLVMQG